ncbi:MAG: hypothetical protein MI757_22135 [Pirellulales bacterium]|nr:hypothetical protein [Pirellulales bacterium]
MLTDPATAQVSPGSPIATPKHAAAQLLAQARQAMKQGNVKEADALIRQAEKLNVKYSMLKFEDTPAKARRDLNKMRGTTTAKPSTRFSPFGTKKDAALPDNPFSNYQSPPAAQPLPGFGPTNPNAAFGTPPATKPTSQIRFGSTPATGVTPNQFERPSAGGQVEPLPKVSAFDKSPAMTPFGKANVTAPPTLDKPPFAKHDPRTSPQFGKPTAPATPFPAATRPSSQIGFVENRPQPNNNFARTAAPSADAFAQKKQRAVEFVRQARKALERGDRPTAMRLAQHARSLQVPESAFGPREDRPSLLMYDLNRLAASNAGAVRPAGGNFDRKPAETPATRADFQPHRDKSHVAQVSGFGQNGPSFAAPDQPAFGAPTQPTPARQFAPIQNPAQFAAPAQTPMAIFQQAEQAMAAGNRVQAEKLYAEAWKGQAQLTPEAQQRIKNYFMNPVKQPALPSRTGLSLVEQAEAKQRMLAKQVESDVMRRQRVARDLLKDEPKAALDKLKETRAMVEGTELKTDYRDRLLRRVDRSIDEAKKYIADNRSQIELDERNRSLLDEIDREQQVKLDVQQRLAELVDEFNTLNDEQRFREAELIVKKAEKLAPKDPLVVQIKTTAMFIRRNASNGQLQERHEAGVWGALDSVAHSSVPYDDRNPVTYIDSWDQLSESRRQYERSGARLRTKKELEIEQKLKTPVLMKFNEEPLSEVMSHLSKVAGIDIFLDPRGLSAEGVSTDTPVSLKLNNEISLKSALNVILNQLQLGYVIEDEMLKITSLSTRENDIYAQTYNVADLIIAIPNFGQQTGMGLQSELQRAMNTATGATSGAGMTPPSAVAGYAANGNPGSMNTHLNPNALGQVVPGTAPGAAGAGLPGGLQQGAGGGASQADFDSLIQLITSTVSPTTWDEVGGPGSIAPFATNLSLVVNQTQEVHEQLVDLLKQLRRNQDLQVTIEVRFIDLSDNFFERIGVDFNFLAYDNIDDDSVPDEPGDNEGGSSMTVGWDGADITGDFEFDQGSFEATIPQVGGVFSPSAAASFGFAVLSDIEAYFFVQAVQSDVRSNTLQAPKVTLFNGQQAFVTNSTQTPFVTSVIPVVGDFAAAHQPVVVVLTEGSSMTVQAVVSPDKRYVRLTVVPFFSKIDSVETFTFEGSETSSSEESEQDDEDGGSSSSSADADGREGTTIQLPTFSFQTVTTTVTVPDGGTVLLGGLKTLREARNEVGVPLLSKIPYINRLFRNVGIGRETRSLMMMVTPRIIILEEEEAKLLGTRGTP